MDRERLYERINANGVVTAYRYHHFGGQRIALSLEGNITDPVTARQQFVEMPFDTDEIKRQVEPVPTGQRRWQQRVDHATKYRVAPGLK